MDKKDEIIVDLNNAYIQKTRNINSYPITISEVKQWSKYFQANPSDTSQDNILLQNIKFSVKNFEEETGFVILDTTIKTYYNDKRTGYFGNYIKNYPKNFYINAIRLCNLNVRNIENIKYYEINTKDNESRILLSPTKYYVSDELLKTPKVIRMMDDCYIDLQLTDLSIEITYKAGYENNNFTNLPDDIKTCLAQLSARNFDTIKEVCNELYDLDIMSVYDDYKKHNINRFIFFN